MSFSTFSKAVHDKLQPLATMTVEQLQEELKKLG